MKNSAQNIYFGSLKKTPIQKNDNIMYFSAENPKTVVTLSKQGGGTAAYNNISLGLFLINHVAILLSPEMEKRKEDFIEQRGATV